MDTKARNPVIMLGLFRAAYWFDEGLRRALKAGGLKALPRAQAVLIIHVALGLRKQTQLADALGISRQAVNRIVGDLVQVGALTVDSDPEDGRGMLVDLAPEGSKGVAEIFKTLAQLERKVGCLIGNDRLEVLRATLAADWGEPDLGAATADDD